MSELAKTFEPGPIEDPEKRNTDQNPARQLIRPLWKNVRHSMFGYLAPLFGANTAIYYQLFDSHT